MDEDSEDDEDNFTDEDEVDGTGEDIALDGLRGTLLGAMATSICCSDVYCQK